MSPTGRNPSDRVPSGAYLESHVNIHPHLNRGSRKSLPGAGGVFYEIPGRQSDDTRLLHYSVVGTEYYS